MIDPRARFLLPCCVRIPMERGIGVTGHVPVVGDAWAGRAERGGGGQCARVLFVVPKMDAVVVDARMVRRFRQHLARQRIHTQVARDFYSAECIAPPDPPNEKRLRFEILRVITDDLFPVADEIPEPLPFAVAPFLLFVKVGKTLQPAAFLRAQMVTLLRHALSDEGLGAPGVLDVRHRDPPVGHRAIGIELEHLAERTLSLEKPKPMELRHALVEKLLSLGRCRGHWKPAQAGDARQKFRALPRSFGK